jgi:autotransporter-associated beta strand protein
VNNTGTILNVSTTLDTAVGSLSGTGASTINFGGAARNFRVRLTAAGVFAGALLGDGNFTLSGLSTNTLTLSGIPSFTGTTTVNGGTLRLDYATNDLSKLSDSAALVLGGGTVDLSGGTHTEVVASTTLTAGTASRITNSTPGAVIALNAISNGAGATLDIAADNIASTDTLNTNGILGTWATVGGTNWATNSTNAADGLIVAYSAYTDVARLDGSSQVINDNNSANVRLIEGTGILTANTLGSATTVINSLNQSVVGGNSAATINMAGQTLRTNAVLVASGAGALTIGAAPNSGTLTVATAGGNLVFTNNGSPDLTVNAVISDNTSASGLTKLGAGWLALTANNTYTGATDVSGGVLYLSGAIAGSPITIRANGELNQETTGLLTGASSLALTSSGTSTLRGANSHTGGTTLTSGNLIVGHESALGTGTFTINGGSFNTDAVVTSLTTNNAMTWNGNFTYNGASSLNLGTGAVTLGANSQVSVSSNTLTVGGVIGGAFSLSKTGNGTLVLNGANVHSGGTIMTGSGSAGTLILGNASALGTGPVTFNANGSMTVDASVPNLVNANNNPINFQGNVTFQGTENLDLGTGPVTILGNRTITVSANTLKIGGGISGAFNFTKAGDGQLVLSGVSTYTGTTTLNGLGAVTITGAGSLGTGNYNGAITNNSGFVYESTANQTLGGVVSGTGAITKSGLGTLVLSGANTFSGGITINDNGGTLQADFNALSSGLSTGATAVGAGSTLVLNNTGGTSSSVTNTFTGTGALKIQFAAITSARSTTIAASLLSNFSSIQLSALGSTGDKWTATGSGTLNALIIDSGATYFGINSSNVNFTGGITVNGAGNTEGRGAIRLGSSVLGGNITLGSSSTISMESATLAEITGNITSGAAGTQLLTLGGTGSLGGFLKGIIGGGTGTISLATEVGGTYFLEGANTYSGSTAVNAGSVVLRNALALGSTTAGTSVANGARVELDGVKVEGESITLSGNGANFLGALQSRSGISEWTGSVTIDADNTRIGSASGATMIVSGIIDDGASDYRIMYRINDAAASVILKGANTYTGTTSIVGLGPVIVESLNKIVDGTPSSHLGAPTTVENGKIIIGTTTVNGVLRYVGAGEITDRSIQIGENNTTPVVGDTGSAAIESDATTTALSFSAPVFNIPTNAATGTSPTRTLTLSGANANANTISGVIQNNQIAGNPTAVVNVTKSGAGSWVLAGDNTYTGLTTITDGTLTLSGNRTVPPTATPCVDVGGLNTPVLNISGDQAFGSSQFRVAANGAGIVNHTAGDMIFTGGSQMTVGVTASVAGIYNLSGGSLTTAAVTNRGVLIGVNANTSGTFNLSGTGELTIVTGSVLQIGRSDAAGSNSTAIFNQTGGSAAVAGTLAIGGNGATSATITASLNISAGIFTANGAFSRLAEGNGDIASINISGTADVTLPAFPTTRGTSATATITFDGGTLKPAAASASYMAGLTNAFILDGGITIDTTNGSITIAQSLLTDSVSTGGGLIKDGANTLTLTGNNTYTGATSVTEGTLALVGGKQESEITVSAGASLGFTLGSPTESTKTFNLGAGTIKITGPATLASYDLISSSAGINGTPVLDAPVPGYELKVEGTSLKLVRAGYAAWAALNGAGVNLNDDHDGDGVPNGIEYFLGGPGGNTTGFNALPGVTNDMGTLSVTWTKSADYAGVYGTDFTVETSDTLTGTWTPETIPGTVTITGNNVTYTFPTPLGTKKFARLKVTGP